MKNKRRLFWIVLPILFTLYFFPEIWRPEETPPRSHKIHLNDQVRLQIAAVNRDYQQNVRPIFEKKCFDCHTSQTRYPWFAHLPLLSTLINWDIHRARSFLDMQNDYPFHSNYDFMDQLYEIETAIEEDKMPLTRYRIINWNFGLTPQEKSIILKWVAHGKKSLMESYQQLVAEGRKWEDAARVFTAQFSDKTLASNPQDNLPTQDKIALGKKLFFDQRLSGSGQISCATCHIAEKYWTDGLKTGLGHEGQQLTRNTPTLMNTAWASSQFWDGRARNLEEQALGPISSPKEMHMDFDTLVTFLKADTEYKIAFKKAYPDENLTPSVVGKALAAFERTMISHDAPFDLWIKREQNAISDVAKEGFVIFNTKANCMKCHAGWRFTDDSFQDIGTASEDLGRGAVINKSNLNHAFKTPTLRNITETGPYMHDGSLNSLEDVIDFYDRGGDVTRDSMSPDIKKLFLTQDEKHALIEFLKTLTEEKPRGEI